MDEVEGLINIVKVVMVYLAFKAVYGRDDDQYEPGGDCGVNRG